MPTRHELDEEISVVAETHQANAGAAYATKRFERSVEKTRDSDIIRKDSKSIEFESTVDGAYNVTPDGLLDSPKKSAAMKRKASIQFFAVCFVLFLGGWDAGTLGPLLPRIQAYYHVNYTMVSLTFVLNCIGFLSGATMQIYMTDRWGFGKVIIIGSIGHLIGYVIMATAPPFPLFCIAYFVNGWGIALQDSLANGYVAGLSENSSVKMGLMHATFGLGAVCSPFSETRFATMPRFWHYHFIVSLGVSAINTAFLMFVFRSKTQDECMLEIGEAVAERGTSDDSKYKQILSQKVVHLLALFSLLYVGVELAIGGYIVGDRNGSSSSGYITTGFYGGLTLGRAGLIWINQMAGEYCIIFVYIILALGLELVVWRVPSLIGDAVAVSFIGLFIGPMYPILMNVTGRLIPPWLLNGSIGWISSFGYAGSALLPFITGALASRFGIVSLQPVLITLLASMLVIWAVVPSGSRGRTAA
ncbi:hypothetical protein M0805_001351 [Coniferiporia weirii]|nr:hypothetical protein M0805_001351 [Coniferiporia weirii]